MATWVDRCESVWIDSSLTAILVTGFTALAMIQCRQPVRRRTWGRLGLTASLCVIPLTWLDVLPRIDLRHPTFITRKVDFHSEIDRKNHADPVSMRGSEGLGLPPSSSSHRRDSWAAPIWHGLFFAYGTGLALGFARLALGTIGTGLVIRRAQAASPATDALLARLPFEHETQARPRVFVSPRAKRPVLVGFLRPTILIPPEFDTPAKLDQLRLGLLHELAHAEVDDSRYGILSATTQAVWFFLPQVWWVRSQLRLDAEFLADHRAVGHYGTSHQYAQSLVGIAAVRSDAPARDLRGLAPTMTPANHRFGDVASALIQRVQMLLKCPFEVEDRVPRGWVFSAAGIMLGWTLATTCLTVQDEARPREEVTWKSVDEAVFAFRLAELAIAPQILENRLFNLQFRLPARFRLACEVFAEPAELSQLEIMEYCLRLPGDLAANFVDRNASEWRQIEIIRDEHGHEEVRVDGRLTVPKHRPPNPAQWLTIRPIPGRMTRLRDLELTW